MSLSEDLNKESSKGFEVTVMRLEPYSELASGSFKRQVQLSPDQKNSYNSNNGIYNIYDEKGSCYVTADATLVAKLAHDNKDLKKNESLGVELSNGMNFSYGADATKWNTVKATGEINTERARQQARLDKEKAAKIAEMRGTAKPTPTPVKKTEMNNTLAGKVLGNGAEM